MDKSTAYNNRLFEHLFRILLDLNEKSNYLLKNIKKTHLKTILYYTYIYFFLIGIIVLLNNVFLLFS
jgi:hypothetical protein